MPPRRPTLRSVNQPCGAAMLIETLSRIFANTPTWVLPLFIALMGFGLSQTRTRTVSARALAIAPLAMAAWSLYSVIAIFGSFAAAATWAAGAAIALGI